MTGASSGIGRAAAELFAREGARVFGGARNVGGIPSDGSSSAHALDVRNEDSVRSFVARVREESDHVDLLLNNAGVGLGGTLLETSTEDFDETFQTNVRGAFLVMRGFAPLLVDPPPGARPRTILNVASILGTIPASGLLAYSASKWALRGMSLCAAEELADRGVRVVSVNPGYVATAMVAGAPYPAGTMVQPPELAEIFVNLATLPRGAQIDDVTVHPHALYAHD